MTTRVTPSLAQLTWQTTVVEADVMNIHRLVNKCGVFIPEEVNVAAELVTDTLNQPPDKGYQFLLARNEQGVIVAYTCYDRIVFTDHRYDLYWIATDPEYQGTGLSTQLYTKTEALILAQGGQHIYAETSGRAAYSRAHHFYLKQGFTLSARLQDFYGDGDDKLIYSKRLPHNR